MKNNCNAQRYRKVNNIKELNNLIENEIIPNYSYKINFDKPHLFIEIEEVLIIAAKLYKEDNKMVYEFVFDTNFIGDHTITYKEIKMINRIMNILYCNKKLITSKFKKYTVEEYEKEEEEANYFFEHAGSAFEKSLEKTYDECVNKDTLEYCDEQNLEEIKVLAKTIVRLTASEILSLTEEVDEIIKTRCKNEKIISYVFDRILSLVFAPKEEIEDLYYRLLNYAKVFNIELSDDYEKIFIEQFGEDSEF